MERYCEAKLEKFSEVMDWVDQYRKFWNNKLDSLESYLAKNSKKEEIEKWKSIIRSNKKRTCLYIQRFSMPQGIWFGKYGPPRTYQGMVGARWVFANYKINE